MPIKHGITLKLSPVAMKHSQVVLDDSGVNLRMEEERKERKRRKERKPTMFS